MKEHPEIVKPLNTIKRNFSINGGGEGGLKRVLATDDSAGATYLQQHSESHFCGHPV